MTMCDKNCFKCPYPDCINDELDAYDVHLSEVMDKPLSTLKYNLMIFNILSISSDERIEGVPPPK